MADQTDRFREAANQIVRRFMEWDFHPKELENLTAIPVEQLLKSPPREFRAPKIVSRPAHEFVIGFLAAAYEQGQREALVDPSIQAAVRIVGLMLDDDYLREPGCLVHPVALGREYGLVVPAPDDDSRFGQDDPDTPGVLTNDGKRLRAMAGAIEAAETVAGCSERDPPMNNPKESPDG